MTSVTCTLLINGMHPAVVFYESTLKRLFPPVRFAFAYGSAVFQQHGRPKGKMLDMVFAVDDPNEWHRENLQKNWGHYSFLRYLGASTIAHMQRYPAGLYYNTLVNVQSQLVKYGVISVQDLMDDLMQWKWLYVSGRLHKPVLILTDVGVSKAIEDGLQYNLRSAALCGVLLQKSKIFTLEELFVTIAGLSFQGDFRMFIGEDKDKIRNIIRPNVAEFERLYEPHLSSLVEKTADGRMKAKGDVTLSTPFWHLPACVQHRIDQGQSLHRAIQSIVASSSVKQSAKGILTAGFKKTVIYSYEKLQKMAYSITRRK